MKINNVYEIEVWKDAINLSKIIYETTNEGSFCRDFGLRDQIRRSCVSIASNIAEGYFRSNNKEFLNFLRIAKGSAGELMTQITIAKLIGYIDEKNENNINEKVNYIINRIGKFISYLKQNNKIKQHPNPLTP